MSALPSTWLDRVVDALALLVGVVLCALTLLIAADVVIRKLGYFSMPWTLDIAEYTLYVVTFLGAPWVLRDGGHIAIDLWVQRLSAAKQRRAAQGSNLLCAVVCSVLFYYACKVWWVSFDEGIQVYETFVFSEWYLLSVAPPTFLLLLCLFLRSWHRLKAPAPTATPSPTLAPISSPISATTPEPTPSPAPAPALSLADTHMQDER